MHDYARIAKVIGYIEENRGRQPGLDELASVLGLSVSRFHRLFATWAGVTPKAFLKCLTVADARRRLIAGDAVLEAAIDSGMSGPGRLHDLCVSLEAASPGEIKSGGAGLRVRYGFADSPFGRCLLAEGARGLCWIEFVVAADATGLQRHWFGSVLVRDDGHASELADRIFAGGGGAGLRAFVRASQFQVQVWRALLRIPEGCLASYGALAEAVGKPGAARAVGTAVGGNPLAYLIPCHRVIRATGVIGDYRWGSGRKQAMVAREGCAR